MSLLRIPLSQEPVGTAVLPDGTQVQVIPTQSYYRYWTATSQDALGSSTTHVTNTSSNTVSKLERQYGKLAYQNVVSLNLPVNFTPNGLTITTEPAGTIFTNTLDVR